MRSWDWIGQDELASVELDASAWRLYGLTIDSEHEIKRATVSTHRSKTSTFRVAASGVVNTVKGISRSAIPFLHLRVGLALGSAQAGTADRTVRGSMVEPLSRTSKWVCGPVEKPVEPIGPIVSPCDTVWPVVTNGWAAM